MRRRHLLRPLVPLAALLTVLASGGCLGPVVPQRPPTAPYEAPGSAPRPSASIDEDGTSSPDEFRRDIRGAQRLAEQYWQERLAAAGVDFRPVRDVVAYERADDLSCAGEPLGLNNAAYCADGDFIGYDVNWAFAAFRQIGDAFLFYLLGHEYAHAIQLRLGIRKQFTIQQELQADCMAGAYLGDMVRAGALRLDRGDIDEFRRGLLAVGDDPGQPWFAEGAHGTARQRTRAFANGYDDSLRACDLS